MDIKQTSEMHGFCCLNIMKELLTLELSPHEITIFNLFFNRNILSLIEKEQYNTGDKLSTGLIILVYRSRHQNIAWKQTRWKRKISRIPIIKDTPKRTIPKVWRYQCQRKTQKRTPSHEWSTSSSLALPNILLFLIPHEAP